MILFDAALSRMTWRVCNPPLADLGGREERSVFICHHSMMQWPQPAIRTNRNIPPLGSDILAPDAAATHCSAQRTWLNPCIASRGVS